MFLNICKLLKAFGCYVFFRVLMKQLVIAERFCLIGHVSMAFFGLAVYCWSSLMPVILNLGGRLDRPPIQWSMAGAWFIWS